jgi:hypothetical protein
MWSYGSGFGYNHTSFDLILVNASKKQSDVITGLTAVKYLTEHFNTGYNSFSSKHQDQQAAFLHQS